MKIDHLKIKNFRNIKNIEYSPHPNLNILVGNNAQGKTNLLEAIYIMSGQNSFRTNADKDLLNYDAANFFLRSKYNYHERSIDLHLNFNPESGKTIKLNNKKVNRSNPDLLKVVLFTPDDLFLVKGSPSKRRYFLDFILKQIIGDYSYNLDNYNKVLRKRNFLLKNGQTDNKSFAIINDLFIESAAKLILSRLNYVAYFDEVVSNLFKEINEGFNQIKIRYALSFPINSDKINLETLTNALYKELQEKFIEEQRRRNTLTGPHLDDLHIYLDNRLVRVFASQGQQRNIVITMKLAEIYTFKKIKGYYPVFLLDEVLSELDNDKKGLLMNKLIAADYQCFLTAVNLDNIDLKGANICTVTAGKLKERE